MQRAMSYPPLLFLGFVSYPLYLLHENAMVSMIVQIGQAEPSIPAFILPLIPMTGIVVVAWLVARFGEPKLKGAISTIYPRLGRSLVKPRLATVEN